MAALAVELNVAVVEWLEDFEAVLVNHGGLVGDMIVFVASEVAHVVLLLEVLVYC